MLVSAEQDKMNWEWLPEIYSQKLEAIRAGVTRLWNENGVNPPLVGFTPHGPEHSKAVEDLMHRLIPDRESFTKLTERERFCLLASAWVHDIGMIRGIHRDDDKLSEEEIRTTHHKRSERFITNSHLKILVDPGDAPALSLLAYYHGENLEGCRRFFPVHNNDVVRLSLIAAYLRLADALDITQSRSPMLNYAICLAYNIPMSSKLHWIKSRLITGIDISPVDHRIMVHFKRLRDDRQAPRLSIQNQNIAKLQKLVMNDLRTDIDSNMPTLVREGISYFLDIDHCSTEMEIDDQVRPELTRLVYNFEMMVHPSSTKLMRILLQTMHDIIAPHRRNCTASIKQKVLDDLRRFMKEIREEILDNRRCHFGLKRLIDDFDALLNDRKLSIDELGKRVSGELKKLEDERRKVRSTASRYFKEIDFSDDQNSKITKYVETVRSTLKEIDSSDDQNSEITKHVETVGSTLEEEEGTDSPRSLSDRLREKMSDGDYINVLLYGLSELVIKAICGFRDFVINCLLRDESVRESIQHHKDTPEAIASTLMRIFVCEGQPKTITAKNDRLTYHDGTKYALELHRRGFSNIMILPDLVVGNLLNERHSENQPSLDYVLLGTNGLEYVGDVEPRKAHFLHSSGHLAIAALTTSLKLGPKPRLILVLSRSKCALKDDKELLRITDRRSETTVKEGFRFVTRREPPMRTQPFLIRDEDIRAELFAAGIRLYNPREDSVELTMVTDIIADGECFIGIDKDEPLESLRKWLYPESDNGRSTGVAKGPQP